ncbi:molybdenum ABC transporter ATP-binding protein [Rivihabitans pingtungensis]|uniref:molybdenum ABC transporter ATP-binding protein n=1 Tax=Rivihabitans pingtungensis TaxID=1054498 RepID=UPI002355A73B|nr:molybdenum ABC transporter ATP-binding protein [Rivihabitans pingtungensis]MCK6437983.1 molybdenum ABC transporter ATP-binding protein [Rivihabitans pingtungensis]
MSQLRARFSLYRPTFSLEVDLHLPGRGVTALFGPSGSGKTTCLRAIAGLERVPGGHVSLGEQVWQDDCHFTPPHQRALGMVFQEASLFAHLNARDNLLFGYQRTPAHERRFGEEEVVELLGIGGLLSRKPHQLSGGERQRVGIGRALLTSPQLLLMDEPLAALDLRRKQEILPYLEKVTTQLEIPVLYVSHAPDEVARLADHMVVLDQGRVLASGALNDVLGRVDVPAVFADDAGTVLSVTLASHEDDALSRLSFAGGDIYVAQQPQPVGAQLRCRVHARDISLSLSAATDDSILNRVTAQIEALAPAPTPGHVLVRLNAGGAPLLARVTQRSARALNLAPGMTVFAQIKAVALLD